MSVTTRTKLDSDWELVKYVLGQPEDARFYVDHSCGGWTSNWVTGTSKLPYSCARCDEVLPKSFQMVIKLLTIRGAG